MSHDELPPIRLLIEPQPTPEELVVILSSLRGAGREPDWMEHHPDSRWVEAARLEQLRTPLDMNLDGWNR